MSCFTGVFTSLIFKCIHKGQSDFVHLFINEPSSWESNTCLFSSKLTFKTCFRNTNSKLIFKKPQKEQRTPLLYRKWLSGDTRFYQDSGLTSLSALRAEELLLVFN